MVPPLTPRDRWAIETMRRQRVVVDEAATAAEAAGHAIVGCRRWLALKRQAASYQRYLEPWRNAAAFDRVLPDVEQHRRAMADHRARAGDEVSQVDEETGQHGPARPGTTDLRRRQRRGRQDRRVGDHRPPPRPTGRQVLAVDLDTNPGLAFSLGLPPSDAGLPLEVLEEDEGANYGWQLTGHMTPREVVERSAVVGPDGVRFLSMGKITSIGKETAKHSVAALVQVLLGLGDPEWDIVADLEAGPTTPFERYHAFASDTLVVVGPTWRSAMTARRLWPMGEAQRPMVVGNRWGDEADHPAWPAARASRSTERWPQPSARVSHRSTSALTRRQSGPSRTSPPVSRTHTDAIPREEMAPVVLGLVGTGAGHRHRVREGSASPAERLCHLRTRRAR